MNIKSVLIYFSLFVFSFSLPAFAQDKPNILIIWGDDIGWNNPSCYNSGMMGYQTPNIDRIAKAGVRFTDWYGQNSCTAGRSTLITGQSGFRTGLLKVGLPGAKEGISILDNICSHEDMLPTILAAAGEPNIKEKLMKGYSAIGRGYKVHLDGYNLVPGLTGDVAEWPRKEFFYWTDDGSLCGLRYDRWKLVFQEQREHGFAVWHEPMVTLRMPKLFCLRTDPFERADHAADGYTDWRVNRLFALVPAQDYVAKHLATYKDFPPRSKPGSFGLEQVLSKLQEGGKK